MTKATKPRRGQGSDDGDDPLLLASEAAKVIGHNTNARQVRRWAVAGRLAGLQRTENAWWLIPLSAAVAMREELDAEIAARRESQGLTPAIVQSVSRKHDSE